MSNGEQRVLARRAFSDRLPRIVCEELRRGLQAADWHESLGRDRKRISAELDRLSHCPAVVRAINLPMLQKMVEDWPVDGWDGMDVIGLYRYVLPEALAMADFIRRASGSNA
jgi:asparagine synthase (glutamine-hydrolysing)